MTQTKKPPDETNGDLKELREWYRWVKTTSRVSWLAVGGLIVLIGGCSGLLAAIVSLLQIIGMLHK